MMVWIKRSSKVEGKRTDSHPPSLFISYILPSLVFFTSAFPCLSCPTPTRFLARLNHITLTFLAYPPNHISDEHSYSDNETLIVQPVNRSVLHA